MASTQEHQIKDTSGKPLISGSKYYIVPQKVGSGGGLVPVKDTRSSKCPYYIGLHIDQTSLGVPVHISSLTGKSSVLTYAPVYIVFDFETDTCKRTFGWKVVRDEKTGQSYVTVTGQDSEINDPADHFWITDKDSEKYTLNYAVGSELKAVGLFDNDGLAGITNDIPLPVAFVEAPAGVSAKKV